MNLGRAQTTLESTTVANSWYSDMRLRASLSLTGRKARMTVPVSLITDCLHGRLPRAERSSLILFSGSIQQGRDVNLTTILHDLGYTSAVMVCSLSLLVAIYPPVWPLSPIR